MKKTVSILIFFCTLLLSAQVGSDENGYPYMPTKPQETTMVDNDSLLVTKLDGIVRGISFGDFKVMLPAATGDMLQSIYDMDNNGVVDAVDDVSGDDLGNHTATQDLEMGSFGINSTGESYFTYLNAEELTLSGNTVLKKTDLTGQLKIMEGSGGSFRISSDTSPTVQFQYYPTSNTGGQIAKLYVEQETGDLYYDHFDSAVQITTNGALVSGTGATDDDITGATLNGTTLEIDEGGTQVTVDLSNLKFTERADLDIGAVGTDQLGEQSVTSSKIAPNAINTGHVEDGALTVEDLGEGSGTDGQVIKIVSGEAVWADEDGGSTETPSLYDVLVEGSDANGLDITDVGSVFPLIDGSSDFGNGSFPWRLSVIREMRTDAIGFDAMTAPPINALGAALTRVYYDGGQDRIMLAAANSETYRGLAYADELQTSSSTMPATDMGAINRLLTQTDFGNDNYTSQTGYATIDNSITVDSEARFGLVSNTDAYLVFWPTGSVAITGNGEAVIDGAFYVDRVNTIGLKKLADNLFRVAGYAKPYSISQVDGLSASSIIDTGFTVSWNAAPVSVGEITSWDVSLDGAAPTRVNNTLSYTFTGLAENTAYNVNVRAVDQGGNVGEYSADLAVATTGGAIYAGNNAADPNNEQDNADGFSVGDGPLTPTTDADAQNGSFAVRIDHDGPDDTSATGLVDLGGLNGAASYTVSVYVKRVSGSTGNWSLRLEDARGWAADVDSGLITSSTGNDYLQYSLTGTTDAVGPYSLSFKFNSNADDADVMLIDNITITEN